MQQPRQAYATLMLLPLLAFVPLGGAGLSGTEGRGCLEGGP